MTTTWNPADISGVTLSSGNLIATANNGSNGGARGTTSHTSGKWYIEFVCHHPTQNNVFPGLGTTGAGFEGGTNTSGGTATLAPSGSAVSTLAGSFTVSFGALTDGEIVSIAVDFTAGLVWFAVGGNFSNWNGSGTANPATGTGGFSTANGSGNWGGVLSGGVFPYMASQGGFSPPNAGLTVVPDGPSQSFTPPSGFGSWDAPPVPSGPWASTEAPDIFAAIGYPGAGATRGDLLSNEAADIFAAVGFPRLNGFLQVTGAGDTFSAFGRQPLTLTMHPTEAADIFHAIGVGRGENGVWISTEGIDTLTMLGHTPIAGTWASTEAADRFSAIGAGVTRVRRRRTFFAT